MNEEELLKRLREAFKLEADERLSDMSSGLLGLEKASDPESQTAIIEDIFREAHSLKGAARAVNLKEIETISQSMESVFSRMKKGEIGLCIELFDTLHESVTIIEKLLINMDSSAPEVKEGIAGVLKNLSEWKESRAVEAKTSGQKKKKEDPKKKSSKKEDPDKKVPEEKAPKKETSTKKADQLKSTPEKEPEESKESAQPVQSTLKPTSRPGEASAINTQMAETVRISTSKLDSILLKAEELISLKLVSSQHSQNLREVFSLIENWNKKWSKFRSEMRWLRREAAKQIQNGDTERDRSGLVHILNFLDGNKEHVLTLEDDIQDIVKASEQDHRNLARFADDLLDEVKRVTMLPFSTLFDGFPRMIRDISRIQDKDVDLALQGGEIEIDRRILEAMKSPFIHLLRNSVDHGLEDPAVRKAAGKSGVGVISLTVSQDEGSKVMIVLADDGNGIDFDKVRDKAVNKGVLTQKEADAMSDQDAVNLIFRSEISTSPIITEISGRGLGMAIVAETVEKLGGLLSVDTRQGQGTTFTIRLPVTLATFRGVLVESGKQLFIVPGAQVERVLRLTRDKIKTVESKASVKVNDQVLSVADLAGVLSLDSDNKLKTGSDRLTLIVVGAGNKRMAFSVDNVVGEQEVVVKGMGRQLSRVPNISGATILGSGRIVPVLNVSDLMKSAAIAFGASLGTAFEGDRDQRQKTILIAEDSITSRMLIKNILESAGYLVKTAVDGLEAFGAFKTGGFDAVVSDVQMPRMDGFELTAKIRAHKMLSETPVVLVTGLDSKQDKERGIEVGANAYIVKTSFEQSNLLEVLDRLI